MSTAIYDCRKAIGEGRPSDAVPASQEVGGWPLHFRNIALSLSLANVCFLLVWNVVLSLAGDEETKYFEMAPPSFGFVASLLTDIGILACFVYALIAIGKRSGWWQAASSAGLALFCCFALLTAEQLLELRFASFTLGIRLSAAATLLLAAVMGKRAKAFVRAALMVLSPLFLLLTAEACWLYSRPELQQLRSVHLGGKLSSVPSHRRVVWIIFDEMDQRLAFEVRPQRVPMPEFDRLRDISVTADHARSPAPHTILSLPSLLTGERVVAERHRSSEISLRFKSSSKWKDFSLEPNVFRRLRTAGFNTALAGWHHPYCRVIGNDLSDCAMAPNGTDSVVFYNAVASWPFWARVAGMAVWNAESLTVAREISGSFRSYLAFHGHSHTPRQTGSTGVPPPRPFAAFANLRDRAIREQMISAARVISDHAVRMARDPALNLVFIHLPSPHLPGIWDSQKKEFTATGPSGYVDNLGFTDFFLGRVRQAIESTGNWDQTTLLISADHPLRMGMWQSSSQWTPELAALTGGKQCAYVPFILKLAGQTTPFVYHRDFNTVVSGDLVWEILNGNISQPEQAARWLDAH